MKTLMLLLQTPASKDTGKKCNNCIRLVHFMRLLQTKSNRDKKQEEHYLRENSAIYKLPVNLIKLDKVMSSDRVYSIHALSWHLKSLCLGLVFAFSLNSVIKSLHPTIVILQQNKKGETMTGQSVAYIRVSAVDQNLESQKELLQKCAINKWFEEKISGKNTDRPQLQAMLEYVREGDTVYIKDLSRLARNTKDLLSIVEYLTNKGVALKSIKENIDTSSNFGKLMITFLAAIYEFERANLLERQKDGIAVAKLKGKYKGRKKVDKPANFSEVYQKWLKREIKSIAAIRELNISEYAFYKFVKKSGSRSGVGGNGEFSTTQLYDGDVGTQALPSTTGAEENANG